MSDSVPSATGSIYSAFGSNSASADVVGIAHGRGSFQGQSLNPISSRHVAVRSLTVAFGAKRTFGDRPPQRIYEFAG